MRPTSEAKGRLGRSLPFPPFVDGRARSGRPLVNQHKDTVADDLRFPEPKLASLGRFLERPPAGPEDHGKDHQVDLIDEVALDQLLDEPVAARHLQLAVELLLEPAHLSHRVAAIENRRVVPLRVLQRRGDDVLRHRIEFVGELPFALRPGAGEALIRAPSDQQSVGVPRLVELELVSVVPAVVFKGPPRVLEVRFAARCLHDAVEGYELRYNDPCCHLLVSFAGLARAGRVTALTAACRPSLPRTGVDAQSHRTRASDPTPCPRTAEIACRSPRQLRRPDGELTGGPPARSRRPDRALSAAVHGWVTTHGKSTARRGTLSEARRRRAR